MNMEHCYNNTYMEKWHTWKKKPVQCHSVHHKPHTDRSGFEPRPPCRSWWPTIWAMVWS